MGNSEELSAIRQVQERPDPLNPDILIPEVDENLIAATLITDSVGKDSITVNHKDVVSKAFSTADRNKKFLEEFCLAVTRGDIKPSPLPTGYERMDFSIQERLRTEAWVRVIKDMSEKMKVTENNIPQTSNSLISRFHERSYFHQMVARVYKEWELRRDFKLHEQISNYYRRGAKILEEEMKKAPVNDLLDLIERCLDRKNDHLMENKKGSERKARFYEKLADSIAGFLPLQGQPLQMAS